MVECEHIFEHQTVFYVQRDFILLMYVIDMVWHDETHTHTHTHNRLIYFPSAYIRCRSDEASKNTNGKSVGERERKIG